jgi:hypothetical protein
VDPVSTSAISWLVGKTATGGASGLKRLLLGEQQQNAFRKVVQASLKAAVLEVVRKDQRDDVLEAVLRDGSDNPDIGVVDVLELGEAIQAGLSERLAALAEQGYEIDAGRLCMVATRCIMVGIRIDAAQDGPLKPIAELLRGERLIEVGEAVLGELTRSNLGLDQVSRQLLQYRADLETLFDQLGIVRPDVERNATTRNLHFIGRDWLFSEVDNFIATHSRGYVLVEGDAGVGKSTFALWLASTRQYASHFTRLPGGRTASVASRNLTAQLVIALGLEEFAPGGIFPPAAGEPHWLSQLITRAAARQRVEHPGLPLVLVVDGLDEAESVIGPPLGLPATLPEDVFVIVTMRTGTPLRWLREEEVVTCKLKPTSDANLDDVRRYLRAAASEPGIRSKLAAANVTAETFVDTLSDRCGGVWIYLRYVLVEIRDGTRPLENLSRLPRGLWAYYTENLDAVRADDAQWESFYLPVLATFGVAEEPISPSVLAALAGCPASASDVRRFLNVQWRAFCAAVADDNFVLYHQSLRDYLVGKGSMSVAELPEFAASDCLELNQAALRAHQRIIDRYLAAWGGIHESLPALADDLETATLDGGYGLRHLPAHLEAAGRDEDVHRLLACEHTEKTSSGVSNTWYLAHERTGTPETYLDHISRAAAIAQHATARERAKGLNAQSIGLCIRYALIKASITSRAAGLPSELITALLARGVWEPSQALTQIRSNPDPTDRCKAFLSVLPHLPEAQRPGVFDEILAAARAITYEPFRVNALRELALQQPQTERLGVLMEALAAARAARTAWDRGWELHELVSHLPQEERRSVMAEALDAAEAISDDDDRSKLLSALTSGLPTELLDRTLAAVRALIDEGAKARALASVALQLPMPQRLGVLEEALDAARAAGDDDDRMDVLSEVGPHLPGGLFGSALEVARTCSNKNRSRALGDLASHLPKAQRFAVLAEALEAAYAVRDDAARARALGGLAPRLPQAQQSAILSDALAAVRASDDDHGQGWALEILTPHLSGDLLGSALETARAINSSWVRACALSDLALRLPQAQRLAALAEALTAVEAVQPGVDRVSALEKVAPRLPADLLALALKVARAIGDDGYRAQALIALSPHLPEIQRPVALTEALEAVQAARDEWFRAEVFFELAPRLPADLFAPALDVAQSVTYIGYRTCALAALAPFLPEGQSRVMLTEVLETVRTIDETGIAKMMAFSILAPHLPAELLGPALKIAQSIERDWVRAHALVQLAPRLNEDLLGRALKTAMAIQGADYRAWVLASLVPHLPPTQRHDALTGALNAAFVIDADDRYRMLALVTLAPSVHADLLGRALDAARSITSDEYRVRALAALISRLPHTQSSGLVADTLGMAYAIKEDDERAGALTALAHVMPKSERPAVLIEALKAARAIEIRGTNSREIALGEIATELRQLDDMQFTQLADETRVYGLLEGLKRSEAFCLLANAAEQIAELGGQVASDYCRTAIRDVVRWWP